ncbi:nucleotidyltransferase domain-containing protein [Methylococcus sp. Mc7]|uniref:nucleotidyltransferase domain-containing protein n=1 Tax=Methylococcus sp. Mc7 TaxID=2860258 RepID=UPI001C52FADE|nr:nucleotidyltransferase domain-containing protein [Methylococcus sp. Mc7]QXP83899.1 nucleotidyltransferase domain-containing protein [Methylococcus sp. Mc7]
MTRTQRTSILRTLQSGLPQLLAVYAFGSRIRGDARPDSDLDLAVLVAGYADAAIPNIAVHDDRSLQSPITISVIEKHLDEFLQFSRTLLLRDAAN